MKHLRFFDRGQEILGSREELADASLYTQAIFKQQFSNRGCHFAGRQSYLVDVCVICNGLSTGIKITE